MYHCIWSSNNWEIASFWMWHWWWVGWKLEKSATLEPKTLMTGHCSYSFTPTHAGIELGFIVTDLVLLIHPTQL